MMYFVPISKGDCLTIKTPFNIINNPYAEDNDKVVLDINHAKANQQDQYWIHDGKKPLVYRIARTSVVSCSPDVESDDFEGELRLTDASIRRNHGSATRNSVMYANGKEYVNINGVGDIVVNPRVMSGETISQVNGIWVDESDIARTIGNYRPSQLTVVIDPMMREGWFNRVLDKDINVVAENIYYNLNDNEGVYLRGVRFNAEIAVILGDDRSMTGFLKHRVYLFTRSQYGNPDTNDE